MTVSARKAASTPEAIDLEADTTQPENSSIDAGGEERGGIENADSPNSPDDTEVSPAKVGLEPARASDKLTPNAIFSRMIDLLRAENRQFAVNEAHELHVYENGRYAPGAQWWLGRWSTTVMERARLRSMWTRDLPKRLTDYLINTAPKLWEEPPDNQVCVRNGILNLDGLGAVCASVDNADNLSIPMVVDAVRCQPHTAEWLSTLQLHSSWNPYATGEEWQEFFGQVLQPDCLNLMWEILGITIIPSRDIQKIIWLDGTGSNGKSTAIDAIKRFIGKENTSAVGVTALDDNRFAAAELFGKLLNFDADSDVGKMRGVHTLKKITGGDEIRGERKGEHAFLFRPFARWILSGNRLPQSKDDTLGFFRRWVIVPFHKNFEKSGKDPSELLAKLSTPHALSGALNLALLGRARLIKNKGLSQPESVKKGFDEFRVLRDPLFLFVKSLLQQQKDAKLESARRATTQMAHENGAFFISKQDLYSAYCTWCEQRQHGTVAGSPRELTQWIQRNLPRAFESTRLGPLDNYSEQSQSQFFNFKPLPIQGGLPLGGTDVTLDGHVSMDQIKPGRPYGWNVYPSRMPQLDD